MEGFWLLAAMVVGIGFLHGVLPDHGWPIAAAYALEKPNRWLSGVAAGLIIGVGHLASSIALVLVFFWLQGTYDLVGSNALRYGSGTILILLGVYEYASDHGHDHEHDHTADASTDGGRFERLKSGAMTSERSLWNLGLVALALGIAHEEPIQIIAICAGTPFCLELMLIYSVAVIIAILIPTLLLIAGYERHRERVERFEPHLSTITAVVLIAMGLAFITGLV